MEWSSVLAALGLLAVTVATVWMAEFAWWKPRRLEHAVRSQGFRGDVKDDARLTKEARSKPISPYSHDIIPRVFPLLHRSIKDYVEVLSDKDGHFVKPSIGPVGRLAITGFATLEGEKWAKHRRIINPAFHVEKLKNFTGDVISRAAFGKSYAEGRRIFQLQVEQASLLLEAVQTIAALIPGYRYALSDVISLDLVGMQEITADPEVENLEPSISKKLMRRHVRNLLGVLNPRERQIVQLRFGIHDNKQKTLTKIGDIFGLTKKRVRQLESRALDKLKTCLQSHGLGAYVDLLI